jgi:putative nucleotidyltransferase with HDIG domain
MDDGLIQDLVRQIEVKDHSTAAHTWRVTLYARAMAELAGLERSMIERLTRAAALHDVGKLEIPDDILQKPGPLTGAERGVIQSHADAGWRWLRAMGEQDELVLGLVRHHHERMDGTGYPDGLRGEAIPLAARHFAVIDSFDAMTSIRPYRTDVSEAAAERALVDLEAHAGSWYCAEAVELFARAYRGGQLVWIHQYFNDSCPLPAFRASAAGAASATGAASASRAVGGAGAANATGQQGPSVVVRPVAGRAATLGPG